MPERVRAILALARLCLGAAAILAFVQFGLPTSAAAQQFASISAGFSPYRLGKPTAVSLGFQIRTADGSLPSALTGVNFHYPRQFGIGTAELGVASCGPMTLKINGPGACPPNSIMGYGSALAEFQVSPEISEEKASIALVAGPSEAGYVKMLISATGIDPVQTRIVMDVLLLPGELQFSVPLVPGIPGGPDVAVAQVKVTIGGHLTYYERTHGRRVAYHPRGMRLPIRCPSEGFRFSATFSFLDGTQAEARTMVRCPHGQA